MKRRGLAACLAVELVTSETIGGLRVLAVRPWLTGRAVRRAFKRLCVT